MAAMGLSLVRDASFYDVVVDLDGCGADYDDEEGRKDAKYHGKSIFTGAFCAFSCTCWRCAMRASWAWDRRMGPIGVPNVSAWTSAIRNERSSSTSVRRSMASRASLWSEPMRTSPRNRENSSPNGPGTEPIDRAMAWSKPRPASTLIIEELHQDGQVPADVVLPFTNGPVEARFRAEGQERCQQEKGEKPVKTGKGGEG